MPILGLPSPQASQRVDGVPQGSPNAKRLLRKSPARESAGMHIANDAFDLPARVSLPPHPKPWSRSAGKVLMLIIRRFND